MKHFRLITLFLILPFFVSAQDDAASDGGSSKGKWEGGLFLGISNYLGDLVEPTFTLKQSNPAFGILLRNHLSDNFGIRANLFYGKIEGDDANYDRNRDRGAKFESTLVELSLMGEYEFLGHKRYTADGAFRKVVSPYIFGGAGVTFGNPDVANGDIEDFGNTRFALPLGLGIKFDLSRKVSLGLEYGTRFTFTDFMDGIKATGDPDNNDIYNFGGLVLGFRFGDKDSDDDGVADEKDKCPTLPGPASLEGCPDSDGDGLADREDTCPNEAGEVRMNGCPDRDGDGVADNTDDCPDQAGLRRFSGCPDTDGDNIIDKEDNCPTAAGIPAMNGCPDSDRDGITDAQDKCPNEAGTGEHEGCPDTDNDGIADNEDDCPNDPGVRKFNGCADTDNDGIADPGDRCPTLAGLAANAGCPEIKAEDQAVLDLAMKNVQFETNSDKLLPSSKKILDQIAEILSRYPGFKMAIDGYTDNVGNDFANQQLSEGRAKSCYDYLATKGIAKATMTFNGHGESNPIADNNTASGRRLNRRVEFKLSPQ
ncbi:MAG: OmpA family protein [Bacteroidetes bacterium]|nr:OmpA family protein [Bacteroidota bacterium]